MALHGSIWAPITQSSEHSFEYRQDRRFCPMWIKTTLEVGISPGNRMFNYETLQTFTWMVRRKSFSRHDFLLILCSYRVKEYLWVPSSSADGPPKHFLLSCLSMNLPCCWAANLATAPSKPGRLQNLASEALAAMYILWHILCCFPRVKPVNSKFSTS